MSTQFIFKEKETAFEYIYFFFKIFFVMYHRKIRCDFIHNQSINHI